MIRRIINLLQNKNKSMENELTQSLLEQSYNKLIVSLEKSPYCNVSTEEQVFIKQLLYKFVRQNEYRYLKLKRLSNKEIAVNYKNYPIGKIRLQGKKTWMQILKNLYDIEVIRDCKLEEYIDSIDLWLKYTKGLKNI